MIDQARLDHWKPLARRDDWHMLFVGSDIREMLAEIERLRAALKFGCATLALFNVKNYHPTLVTLQAQLLAGLEQKSPP
jgi:hypothetical protein